MKKQIIIPIYYTEPTEGRIKIDEEAIREEFENKLNKIMEELYIKCDQCQQIGNYSDFDNENIENFYKGKKCICRNCQELNQNI